MLVGEVVALESNDSNLYRHFHTKPLCLQTPHHHCFIESVCRKAITTTIWACSHRKVRQQMRQPRTREAEKKKSFMSLSGHSNGVTALTKLPTMSETCKFHSLEATLAWHARKNFLDIEVGVSWKESGDCIIWIPINILAGNIGCCICRSCRILAC